MSVDEIVKALRTIAEHIKNGGDGLCFDICGDCKIAADQLERLNDFEQSQCAKLLIKIAEKNEVIQELQTENEHLKKSRPISCGECKYYNYLEPQRCALCNFEVLLPDDFCSYGERRDAE